MANGNTAARQTSDDVPMLLPPLPPSLASHPRYCTQTTFWVCKIQLSALRVIRGSELLCYVMCSFAWRPWRGPYADNAAAGLFPYTGSSFFYTRTERPSSTTSITARFYFIFFIYILGYIIILLDRQLYLQHMQNTFTKHYAYSLLFCLSEQHNTRDECHFDVDLAHRWCIFLQSQIFACSKNNSLMPALECFTQYSLIYDTFWF